MLEYTTIPILFLLVEGGSGKCFSCGGIICKTCTFILDQNKKPYCAKCYAEECLLPQQSADVPMPESLNKSTGIMRKEILGAGFDVGEDACGHEVEEVYNFYVINKGVDKFRKEAVKFPVLTPDEAINAHFGVSCLINFDLRDGGRFVSSVKLSLQDISSLLDLFATMVTFNNTKHTEFDAPIYKAIPSFLVEFAFGSRIGSGYRLLRRCIRHAMDPLIPSLLNENSNATIFKYEGNLGIVLKNKVPASMRKKCYPVEVGFTAHALVYCKCNCQSGSCGKFRITCVHILPVIYQMCLLVVDGLAEQILVELSSRLNILNESYSDSDFDVESIISLMSATGENTSILDKKLPIKDLLEKFTVGTDKRKSISTGLPHPAFVGPIKDILKVSVEKRHV